MIHAWVFFVSEIDRCGGQLFWIARTRSGILKWSVARGDIVFAACSGVDWGIMCSLWHEDTLGLNLGYSYYYESGVSYSGRGGISPAELFGIFCHCSSVIWFDSVLVYLLCVYKRLGIAIAILQPERDKLFLMKLLPNRMMCHVLLAGAELSDTWRLPHMLHSSTSNPQVPSR